MNIFPLQRTNGRVLPAQWRLLPPSKSSHSEGFKFEIKMINLTAMFCRRRQRYQLLPFVHNAKHEEENIHLLLPLVQVIPQSSILKAPLNPKLTGRCKISPLEVNSLRLHMSSQSHPQQHNDQLTNTFSNISALHLSYLLPMINYCFILKVNFFQIFQHGPHLLRPHPQLKHS